MTQPQEWSGVAEPSVVGRLRGAVDDYARGCGYSGAALFDLRTCVSEAVTNSVVHGFRDGRPPGTVRVRAKCDGNGLEVTVCDDGVGPARRSDSPGLGLGLGLIEAATDAMSVGASREGGTRVWMTFVGPAWQGSEPAGADPDQAHC